jgi:predicted transglutaminase-like cysteine proteinase
MTKTRIFAPIAAAALLAASGAPAFAKSQDSQGSGSVVSVEEKGERKICKRFQNSASRTRSERVCLTKTQWKKFQEQQ